MATQTRTKQADPRRLCLKWKCSIVLLMILASAFSQEPPRQPDAELEVRLIDGSSGMPVQARAYLTDERGQAWAPPGLIAYDYGKEHHFIVPNAFTIRLRAGKYILRLERGPEYRSSRLTIDLAAGRRLAHLVRLERWIDMNRLGWYSGDLHNHRRIDEMPALLAAEDLNLAPVLTSLVPAKQISPPEPSSKGAVRQADSRHVFSVLDRDINRPVDSPGGLGLLALSSPFDFDGYRLYPPSDTLGRLARAQGGHIDAQEVLWRETAALAAFHHFDSVGIIHECFTPHGIVAPPYASGLISYGPPAYDSGPGILHWGLDVYYRLLNICFRLPVSAGTGSGSTQSPLGYNRVYVHVDRAFNYQDWFEALRSGHSFATNGPMLFLRVNGAGPGSALSLYQSEAQPVRIQAEAVSPRPLDRLEIVHNGSVLQSVSDSNGRGTLSIDIRRDIADVGWVAARCFERPAEAIRFAHTSPVYLQKGEQFEIAREDVQFFIDWIEREIRYYSESGNFQSVDHLDDVLSFYRKAERFYRALLKSARRPLRDAAFTGVPET
jgi:hypothetical protein